MQSASSGFTKAAFLPAISGIDDVLLVTTAVPQAMASSNGIPQLSRNEV